MTHLRKIMLEELQRRNYSDGTIRATCTWWKTLPVTSASRRTSWVWSICEAIRPTC